jgi:hypothetical protein
MGITAATFESLAAAGFVSPGRSLGEPIETSAEVVDPDAAPAEGAPPDSTRENEGAASVAAYWRWMHARLDEHLEGTHPDDLGAPTMHSYRPLALFWSGALDALEPSRSVGIRDRSAFDARAFDGLRDGFTHLG